jgi:hypothetical protein
MKNGSAVNIKERGLRCGSVIAVSFHDYFSASTGMLRDYISLSNRELYRIKGHKAG